MSRKLLGGGIESSAEWAAVASHENAHARGFLEEQDAHMSGLATYLGVTGNLGITADDKLITEMLFGGLMNDNSANEDGVYHWKMMAGGTLAYDGQGWLVDEDGLYVNIDGTRSEMPEPGKTLGADGVETGLMNIIAGTSNKAWDTFSDGERVLAQLLMLDSGMTPDDRNVSSADWHWATNKPGTKLDMNYFFMLAGEDAPEELFRRYYGSLADLELTEGTGLDLMFTEDDLGKYVPYILQERFENLKMDHLSQIPDFMSVKDYMHDKYLFTMDMEDGTKQDFLKLTKSNPFWDMLPGQHDFKVDSEDPLYDQRKGLDTGGCNFMVQLAAAQLLTGTMFSDEQIWKIWDVATENGYMDYNGTVVLPSELSSLAFAETDYKNMRLYVQGSGNIPPTWIPDYTIVSYRIDVPYGDNNNGHKTLGNLLYSNDLSSSTIFYNPGYTTGNHTYRNPILFYEN